MSQRLVKVAKELSVGTDRIVAFLSEKGYEIEPKPTSIITEEMHDLLVKEFSSNMAIQEQADNMVIGNRPSRVAETAPPVVTPPAKEKEPEAKPTTPPPVTVKKAEVEEK